jgi:hypothetical protein
MTFKVTPINKQTGAQAPSMIIEASRDNDAAAIAKSSSGLGRFESWSFHSNVKQLETNKRSHPNQPS